MNYYGYKHMYIKYMCQGEKTDMISQNNKHAYIIHLDMDAFYPSVEILDNPALKGRPVIVGGGKERGVVSSASYEARKFGVHSAQPMATAMRLCPNGVFLGVRMKRYKEISDMVFEIFYRFTPLVEPLSIDEAFLDVTGSERLFGRPEEIAMNIKDAVRKEIGLTVSAGVAPSKFVAKIASDINKPDGLMVVEPDKVGKFLDRMPIERMWGAGKVTQEIMLKMGIRTFRDLSQTPVEILENKFGAHGRKMQLLSMGIDDREVVPERDAKSIGHEDTFMKDILDIALAKKELLSQANRVARRMRKEALKGKTITLKMKYSDFKQITRSATLPDATDDARDLYMTVCELLKKTSVGKRPVRLLGISVSKLEGRNNSQLFLFPGHECSKKKEQLHKAMDSIWDRYGDKSLQSGTLVPDKK
jgi:DNA polymerase IV